MYFIVIIFHKFYEHVYFKFGSHIFTCLSVLLTKVLERRFQILHHLRIQFLLFLPLSPFKNVDSGEKPLVLWVRHDSWRSLSKLDRGCGLAYDVGVSCGARSGRSLIKKTWVIILRCLLHVKLPQICLRVTHHHLQADGILGRHRGIITIKFCILRSDFYSSSGTAIVGRAIFTSSQRRLNASSGLKCFGNIKMIIAHHLFSVSFKI